MDRPYRPASPGSRRLTVPERASTGTVNSYDPVYYPRTTPRDIYNPPRGGNPDSGGGGVIPISTTTYVANRPPTITRNGSSTSTGYDPYSGRPRRSTLTEADAIRGGSSHHRSGSSRTRPAVIQTGVYEQSKSPRSAEREYFIQPSTSGSVRSSHKKVYSVDGGKSRLVDDKHGRSKRDSVDRPQYTAVTSGNRHKPYHLNGPARSQGSLDDYGYSYTDPASMYRDTEPRWRSRRGSIESSRRDRPTSMLEAYPAKSGADRQSGPPPSTRGFDKIGETLQRTSSLQNNSARPAITYDLQPYDPLTNTNGLTVPVRPASARPPTTVHQDPPQRYSTYADDYEREPRRSSRKVDDSNVESRGFGIRSGSIDRYAPRETSLDRRNLYHTEPLVSEPDLRRYIPDAVEPSRREPDRREREFVKEIPKGREIPRDRDRERDRDHDRESVRDRDRERNRDREKDRDWDREREKERERERDRDREREKEQRARERERERELEMERRRRDEENDRKQRDRERHRDRERDEKDRDEGKSHFPGVGAAAAAIGAAALGGEALRERKREKERDYEEDDRTRSQRKPELKEDLDVDRRYPVEEPRERQERRPSPRDSPSSVSDADAEYRRRVAQFHHELHPPHKDSHDDSSQSDDDKDRRERRRERRERRERDAREREERDRPYDRSRELDKEISVPAPAPAPAPVAVPVPTDDRRNSVFDAPLMSEPDSLTESSSTRESRVRIVEPPKDDKDEAPAPKSILRKPTEKFPEDPNPIREGVAPLKDASKKGIPPGARWTKIDRRLVNPEALEEAKERFEERLDCVIVLRVLSREEIQKFADRTKEIRDERYDRERKERKQRRHEERARDPEGYASRHPHHHHRRHSRTESGSGDADASLTTSTTTSSRDEQQQQRHHRHRGRDRHLDGASSDDSEAADGAIDYTDSDRDERDVPKAIEPPPPQHVLPLQIVPGQGLQASPVAMNFAGDERAGAAGGLQGPQPQQQQQVPWANGGAGKEDGWR